MQHIKGQTTIAGLQRKLGRYGIGYERQGDLCIFRTSKQTMPNCFLRGLIVTEDLAIVCSPFCTSTVKCTDEYARTAHARSMGCTESLQGVIVRLYHYPGLGWRYATKSSTNLEFWNDGTPFSAMIEEACPGFSTGMVSLDTGNTYVLNLCHPKTTGGTSEIRELVHITTYCNGTLKELPYAKMEYRDGENLTTIRRPCVVDRPRTLDGERPSIVYRIRKPDNDLYVAVLGQADIYRQCRGNSEGLFRLVVEGHLEDFLRFFPDDRERVEAMQSRVDRLMESLVPVVNKYRRNPRSVEAQSGGIGKIIIEAGRSREKTDLAIARVVKRLRYEELFPAEIEPSVSKGTHQSGKGLITGDVLKKKLAENGITLPEEVDELDQVMSSMSVSEDVRSEKICGLLNDFMDNNTPEGFRTYAQAALGVLGIEDKGYTEQILNSFPPDTFGGTGNIPQAFRDVWLDQAKTMLQETMAQSGIEDA